MNGSSTDPSLSGDNLSRDRCRSLHKQLLVVDDNEDIHMMLSDRLKAMGYVVLQATNGVEALNILTVMPVAGMLLDIHMPVMDGLTLLRQLQRQDIRLPVIVMSAGDDQQQMVKALELGAMDYLEKPINAVLFAQKCERLFS